MGISMTNLPQFILREIEKLEEVIAPFLKKASRYYLWSIPLIFVSLFNLVFLLLFDSNSLQSMLPAVLIYAVLGALGMALAKESKMQRKEIEKLSSDYIIKRMSKSEIVTENVKNEYIAMVKNKPSHALEYFIRFLQDENRARV